MKGTMILGGCAAVGSMVAMADSLPGLPRLRMNREGVVERAQAEVSPEVAQPRLLPAVSFLTIADESDPSPAPNAARLPASPVSAIAPLGQHTPAGQAPVSTADRLPRVADRLGQDKFEIPVTSLQTTFPAGGHEALAETPRRQFQQAPRSYQPVQHVEPLSAAETDADEATFHGEFFQFQNRPQLQHPPRLEPKPLANSTYAHPATVMPRTELPAGVAVEPSPHTSRKNSGWVEQRSPSQPPVPTLVTVSSQPIPNETTVATDSPVQSDVAVQPAPQESAIPSQPAEPTVPAETSLPPQPLTTTEPAELETPAVQPPIAAAPDALQEQPPEQAAQDDQVQVPVADEPEPTPTEIPANPPAEDPPAAPPQEPSNPPVTEVPAVEQAPVVVPVTPVQEPVTETPVEQPADAAPADAAPADAQASPADGDPASANELTSPAGVPDGTLPTEQDIEMQHLPSGPRQMLPVWTPKPMIRTREAHLMEKVLHPSGSVFDRLFSPIKHPFFRQGHKHH